MFTNNFDPVALQILSFEIRWYSLAYILGILLGWIYCKKILIKNNELLNLFDDFVTYLIVGILVGGRLGYVLFYDLTYFLNNPSEILMIWNGGMSFHGGLIGIIISSIIYAKKVDKNFYTFLDLVSVVAPIGIFFGRIANFINSELYGTETNVPWSVKFILVDNLNRHPSQLYEAILEGLVLFLIIQYFVKKNLFLKPGLISALFLIFYSLFRFLSEFFRNPDPHIGYLMFDLTLGQLMSIIFFFIGLSLFYKKNEIK